MTTLILASQKIFSRASARTHDAAESRLWVIGRSHILTYALIGVIILGVAVYAAAVISLFSTGVELRAASQAHIGLEREVSDLEVKVHSREAEFAAHSDALLPDMEKVSSVIYLDSTSGSVAMNRAQ